MFLKVLSKSNHISLKMKKYISILLTVLATQFALFAQLDCSEEMVWDLFYSSINSDVVDLPEGAETNFTINNELVDGLEGVFEIFATDILAVNTLCIEFSSDDCPDPIFTCQTVSLIDLMFEDLDDGDDWGDDWEDDWDGDWEDWSDSTDGDWGDWGDDWDDWSDSTDGGWDDWEDDWDDWSDSTDGDWGDWGDDWDDWGDDWEDDWDGDWEDWSDSTDGDWGDWGDDWDDWSDSTDGGWDDWEDDWDDWSDSTDGDWGDWEDDWDDWSDSTDGDWGDWGDDWDDWSDSTDGDWDDWEDDWDGDWDDWGDDNNDEDDYDGEGQDEILSIESINSEIDISLYPVPARDNLTIKGLPERNWEAMIFDSYGRLVSNQIISNMQMVDLNNINNGCYSIHIVGLDHFTKRFIIRK